MWATFLNHKTYFKSIPCGHALVCILWVPQQYTSYREYRDFTVVYYFTGHISILLPAPGVINHVTVPPDGCWEYHEHEKPPYNIP